MLALSMFQQTDCQCPLFPTTFAYGAVCRAFLFIVCRPTISVCLSAWPLFDGLVKILKLYIAFSQCFILPAT